jgi:hypothetical protein
VSRTGDRRQETGDRTPERLDRAKGQDTGRLDIRQDRRQENWTGNNRRAGNVDWKRIRGDRWGIDGMEDCERTR